MNKMHWLTVALAILGFVAGCGGGADKMPTEAPPGDPALDNITDGSAYALPEEEPAN